MTIRSVAKWAAGIVAPGYLNKRYLAWATAREAEILLLPALVNGGTAVDIGANRGLYVHHLLKLTDKVIAFEPLPPMQRWLRRNYGQRLDLRSLALSDQSDVVEIRYPKGNYSWATIANSNQLELAKRKIESLKVPMIPLDDLNLRHIDFIKIDVEGHEEPVLRGGLATIRQAMPNLLIEIEERHSAGSIQRVPALLADMGYAGFYLQDGKLHDITEFNASRDQRPADIGGGDKTGDYINNFIFVPVAKASAFRMTCIELLGKC